jgi:hypothetical protein
MNKITFDQEHYHALPLMEEWCREHFGPGTWIFVSPNDELTWPGKSIWQELDSFTWAVNSHFGNLTFIFKHDNQYAWFVLRWS